MSEFIRMWPTLTKCGTVQGMLQDRVHGIKETLFHDPFCQRPRGGHAHRCERAFGR